MRINAAPIWLSLTVVGLLIAAYGHWPYGYYQFLRIVVTGYAGWMALCLRERRGWPWLFGLIAIVFNPLFKITMSRELHGWLNLVAAVMMLAEVFLRTRKASIDDVDRTRAADLTGQ